MEIRWDSLTGTLLGTAQGPNFSITVTIPQSEPGVHYLTAVQYSGSGAAQGQARAAYEVTPYVEQSSVDEGGATGGTSSGTRSANSDGGEEQQSSAPAGSSSTSNNQTASSTAQTSSHAGHNESTGSTATGAAPAPGATPTASRGDRQIVPSSANAAAVATNGKVVFGSSLPPTVAIPVAPGDGAVAPTAEAGTVQAPTAGGQIGPPTTAGPGLRTKLASAGNAVGGFTFVAGLVLLTVGAAVLIGHIAFNGARRRVVAGSW